MFRTKRIIFPGIQNKAVHFRRESWRVGESLNITLANVDTFLIACNGMKQDEKSIILSNTLYGKRKILKNIYNKTTF